MQAEHAHAVIVKLTPNITDVGVRLAAQKGGADAVSDQYNQFGDAVDLDIMAPSPHIDGKILHGGLRPGGELALSIGDRTRPETIDLPISASRCNPWRDGRFMALGAGTVRVCTAAMTCSFE